MHCIPWHQSIRESLNRSDIVHGTLLVKISQSDVPAGLINLDRCDGRGYFLYQGKLFLPIAVIGAVNQILKGRAPEGLWCSRFPSCVIFLSDVMMLMIHIKSITGESTKSKAQKALFPIDNPAEKALLFIANSYSLFLT